VLVNVKYYGVSRNVNSCAAYLISVVPCYPGDDEVYYSLITPEAYDTLKEWMDFRVAYGEKITGESWVMRDIWQTTNVTYGAKWGLSTAPKKLHSSAIKRLIERALWEQGIRRPADTIGRWSLFCLLRSRCRRGQPGSG
jgi:hypothetical protein